MNIESYANKVSRLLTLLDVARLSRDQQRALHALGICQFPEHSQVSVLPAPASITEFYRWDRWVRDFDYDMRMRCSLAILTRLLEFRNFLLACFSATSAWQSEHFYKAANMILENAACTAAIQSFADSKCTSDDVIGDFDKKLHLVCTRFLYNVQLRGKLLGQTGFECCTLYMQAMELLDHELPHSRQLNDRVLAAVRSLLVDDEWNVGQDGCQLKFRPTCEAIIRAIQLDALRWMVDGQSIGLSDGK